MVSASDLKRASPIRTDERRKSSENVPNADRETKRQDLVSSTAVVDENRPLQSEPLNGCSTSVVKSKRNQVSFKTVLTNPGYEYWKQKNPVVDKVFITDVVVDLNTVTIRECSTEKGFFRERPSENKIDIENK